MKCLAHITGNPDGHDWVLVPAAGHQDIVSLGTSRQLLWACPCGEFKWTSYAEWEKSREIAEPAKATGPTFPLEGDRLYPHPRPGGSPL